MTIHEIAVGSDQSHWYTIVYDDDIDANCDPEIRVNDSNGDEGGTFSGLDAASKVSALCKEYDRTYTDWCHTPNPDQEPHTAYDGKRVDYAWGELRSYVGLPEE